MQTLNAVFRFSQNYKNATYALLLVTQPIISCSILLAITHDPSVCFYDSVLCLISPYSPNPFGEYDSVCKTSCVSAAYSATVLIIVTSLTVTPMFCKFITLLALFHSNVLRTLVNPLKHA